MLTRTELVLAMRLHLLIYGAAAGKPLLGISYDKKVDAMLAYLGYDAPIPVSGLAENMLSAKALTLFGKEAPCSHIDALKAKAKADAKAAVDML